MECLKRTNSSAARIINNKFCPKLINQVIVVYQFAEATMTKNRRLGGLNRGGARAVAQRLEHQPRREPWLHSQHSHCLHHV